MLQHPLRGAGFRPWGWIVTGDDDHRRVATWGRFLGDQPAVTPSVMGGGGRDPSWAEARRR